MPAVVEVQDTPPSPTARIFLKGLIGFITIALLWALIGKIDIVATGQGKTVPTGRVKVIQPLESGVIKAIHVQDGQAVKAGEVLLELDLTMTTADKEKLQQQLALTDADITRLNALLHNMDPVFNTDISPTDQLTQQTLFEQAKAQHIAEIGALSQQLAQKKHEIEGAQAEATKLSKLLPLISERSASYKRLAQNGYVAKNLSSSIEEQRIQTQYDLATQRAKVSELGSAIQTTTQQINDAEATFKRNILNELNEKTQKRVELAQNLTKAEEMNRLQKLTSPIDGTVQELHMHTVGGVVTPAQEIMKVVPHEDALEAEVQIQNKDIGFVQEGQKVRIKFDAFPFTKYGIIEGTVKKLSLDAVNDEKLGLVYIARIALKKATLNVENKVVLLTPGLALTSEIKTGSRHIIEYFLSPIQQYSSEAIRER